MMNQVPRNTMTVMIQAMILVQIAAVAVVVLETRDSKMADNKIVGDNPSHLVVHHHPNLMVDSLHLAAAHLHLVDSHRVAHQEVAGHQRAVIPQQVVRYREAKNNQEEAVHQGAHLILILNLHKTIPWI